MDFHLVENRSDYPNIRIVMDILEMLEDARILGCRYDMRSGTVNEETLSLYVGIVAIHSPNISRHIHYSTNHRPELELLSYDIQRLLCNERQAQTKDNQQQSSILP